MPTIFLYNFDKDTYLLSFLDKFWEKDKDYFLIYSSSDESLKSIKEFAQNQEAYIIIKDDASSPNFDNAKVLSDFITKIASSFSSYELSNVYLYYILFDSDLYISKEFFEILLKLKLNTSFLKAVIFFSDRIDKGYLKKGEIISNLTSLLKLLKHSSFRQLSEHSLFLYPSSFRFSLISVPLLEDMDLFSLNLIDQILNGRSLSLIEQQEIKEISSILYSNLKDNIQLQLHELPNVEGFASQKEEFFIYNFDLFQNETLKALENKINHFSETAQILDLLSSINLKNEIIKEEKNFSDFNKINCFYSNLLSKFQQDSISAFPDDLDYSDFEKIFSNFKERVKQSFSNIYKETELIRNRLKSFKKILISIIAFFFSFVLLDIIIFHFTIKYKIILSTVVLVSLFWAFLSSSVKPKIKLKRAYYLFLKELRAIDKNLVQSINNYFHYLLKISLEKRYKSFNQIRQNIINKIKVRKEQKIKDDHGHGYYPISIKESLSLDESNFSFIRAEFFNRIIAAIDVYDNYDIVSEEILENISSHAKQFLQNKITTLRQFWGKEYKEIEILLNNLSSIINSECCLPSIVGCDIKETKFIIAKPQHPPDFLNRTWATPIFLDSDKDIIFGIWGSLELSKEVPKEIPGRFDKKYVWTYQGKDYSLEFKISKDSYFKFKKRKRKLMIEQYGKIYVSEAINDEIKSLAKILDDLGSFHTPYERAAFIVSFVQQVVTYKHEEGEYPRYPIESLVDQAGDFEDFAILGAALLKCLGFEVCLIYLIDVCHISLGVSGIEDIPGDFHEYQGRKYYHCELAGTGWQIGKIPDELRHSQIRIIPIP